MKDASQDKQSKVERAKRQSRFLRGGIAEALSSDATGFDYDDGQALKFHGIYQQTDRDARSAARALGVDKDHWFMVRVKIPAGALTASQYLALDDLAERFSHDRSLRVTTRQGIQFHGILKHELKETIQGINATLLSTLAACGDLERNVMAPPTLGAGAGQAVARDLASRIASELCPQTGAYHEIWLDGEKVESGDEEPLYGEQYLPRKFKTGIGLPEDNSVEVHSQDVGIVAFVEGDSLAGANILVGGGLGLTHRKESTFARLATPLGHVDADQIVPLVRAVAELFRDHGDRADRRHARLKYLIEEWGMDRFRGELLSRLDFELQEFRQMPELRVPDHVGRHPQGDGRFYYGVWVPNGRVIDGESRRLKTALRKIVEVLEPDIVLTPRHDVVFQDLTAEQVETIETVLESYGVPLPGDIPGVQRFSMACPALPTCGLALAESERLMPTVLEELESELRALDLHDEPITVRMTGCPNGCARPYTADLGFVGRRPGEYDIFVGGTLRGDRLAERYAKEVSVDELVTTLVPLLQQWRGGRHPGEPLGDYYQRCHARQEDKRILTGAEEPALTPEAVCI